MSGTKAWIAGSRSIVTGAGGDVGRATAVALARRGSAVTCVDIDAESASSAAALCGKGATSLVADVRDREALADLAEELGEVDIAVNNAGASMVGRFTDMTLDDWERLRSVDLDGVVHGCAVFGPPMLERGRGHVVNVSSGFAFTPVADMAGSCTTEAAVLMLSQCLRADWAQHGVGVSAVCPGRGREPEVVAHAVVKAIEADKAMVIAGWEAKLAWAVHRLGPRRFQQAIAERWLVS